VESEAQGRTLIVLDKFTLSFLLSCCISLCFFLPSAAFQAVLLSHSGSGASPRRSFSDFYDMISTTKDNVEFFSRMSYIMAQIPHSYIVYTVSSLAYGFLYVVDAISRPPRLNLPTPPRQIKNMLISTLLAQPPQRLLKLVQILPVLPARPAALHDLLRQRLRVLRSEELRVVW
jgi:hypothetical protein